MFWQSFDQDRQPTPIIFDPGLQPERTKLSWTRTLLLLLVATGAIVKVISVRHGFLACVLLGCSIIFALSFSILTQKKYWEFTRGTTVQGNGLFLFLIAVYTLLLGGFSLTWVLL